MAAGVVLPAPPFAISMTSSIGNPPPQSEWPLPHGAQLDMLADPLDAGVLRLAVAQRPSGIPYLPQTYASQSAVFWSSSPLLFSQVSRDHEA